LVEHFDGQVAEVLGRVVFEGDTAQLQTAEEARVPARPREELRKSQVLPGLPETHELGYEEVRDAARQREDWLRLVRNRAGDPENARENAQARCRAERESGTRAQAHVHPVAA